MNRNQTVSVVERCVGLARMVALNACDPARFESLFVMTPSTIDSPSPERPHDDACVPGETRTEPVLKVLETTVNLITLRSFQEQQVLSVLEAFIRNGMFPVNPERLPACIDSELRLPFINELRFFLETIKRRSKQRSRNSLADEILVLQYHPLTIECLTVRDLMKPCGFTMTGSYVVFDCKGLRDMLTLWMC